MINTMKNGKASWTAEITAVSRATESIRPAQERLLNDVYAEKFIRPSFRLILKNRLITSFALWLMIDRRFPGASATIVSRIRLIDDCLKNCIKDGIEQLVILGAGYDARSYRFDELNDRVVFEVDHPNTQKLKIKKVKDIFGILPRHVRYVPVDFEKDELTTKLSGAGFNQNLKTLFLWEGVCKYLTPDAVSRILTMVSCNCCKGSSIVFDYLFQSMVDRSSGSLLADKMLNFQVKKDEPFIFGLPDINPEQTILKKGFSKVKNFTAKRIKSMYINETTRIKKIHPFWGVIHAIV